jgi:hypothetical protein
MKTVGVYSMYTQYSRLHSLLFRYLCDCVYSGRTIPKMRELCTITADLSRLRSSLTMQDGANGARFWKVSFKVCVLFGGTRLQARLQWMEGVSTWSSQSRAHIMNSPLTMNACYRQNYAKDL